MHGFWQSDLQTVIITPSDPPMKLEFWLEGKNRRSLVVVFLEMNNTFFGSTLKRVFNQQHVSDFISTLHTLNELVWVHKTSLHAIEHTNAHECRAQANFVCSILQPRSLI